MLHTRPAGGRKTNCKVTNFIANYLHHTHKTIENQFFTHLPFIKVGGTFYKYVPITTYCQPQCSSQRAVERFLRSYQQIVNNLWKSQ